MKKIYIAALCGLLFCACGAPRNLFVPPMAFCPQSIVLSWEKPADYEKKNIVDYEVWKDGKPLKDTSSVNFSKEYQYLDVWNKAFYEGTKEYDHYKITYLSYRVTNLTAGTQHSFKVRALYANGRYSSFSKTLKFSAAPLYTQIIEINPDTPGIASVTERTGAFFVKDAGGDAFAKAAIRASTKALQTAIDAVPYGGKIVLKGTGDNASPVYYVSGSVYLHSNMTFEIEEGAVLLGSPVTDDYDRNFLLYPYSQDIRSQALINAISWDYETMENIRLCGQGIVDGNGWKIAGTGVQDVVDLDPANVPIADPTNGAGAGQWLLPRLFAGSRNNVSVNGILAADSMDKANADAVPNQGGNNSAQKYNTRPQLTTFRGVKNICIDGLIFTNPAFHGIVFYHSTGISSIGTKTMTFNSNNADGIEFGDCSDMYIINNFYDAGDDAINFAAGQGAVVRNTTDAVASGRGRIINNYVRNGHGALVAAGSHTGGWIGDLLVEDNIFKGSETGGAGVIRLKSGGTTGGGVRNIVFRDSAVHHQRSSAPVLNIDRNYIDGNASTGFAVESEVPVVYENIIMRNITVSGVSARDLVGGTEPTLARLGYKMIAREIHVSDIRIFSSGEGGNRIRLQDVSNSSFKNIFYNGNVDYYVTLIDCRNITVRGITGTSGIQKDIVPVNLSWRGTKKPSVSVNGNLVTIKWKPLKGAAGYTILAQDETAGYFTERAFSDTASWSGYFSPDTKYSLAVIAHSVSDNGNTTTSGNYLKTSFVTKKSSGTQKIPVLPENRNIGDASHSGISWMNLSWNNASCENGIQYYKITVKENNNETEYRAFYDSYWTFDSPLGHQNRGGFGLSNLKDGVEYTAAVTAVNWAGLESETYDPLVFTTVPATLNEIPRWKKESRLTTERKGDILHLYWDESDITSFSRNDDHNRFAGFRIIVNGVPVPAVSLSGETLNQVNAVVNTKETYFALDTSGFKSGVYTISVEAGNELLKFASGTGGLEGSASFLGTQNTNEPRNNITFGKWTGHGPSVTIEIF
ncbi:MAG: glycosyl hydrolase family 28 protein [Treponema sp.]|nr:glycosyl hydrolase family 28 protein [Treponema sp.]